MKKTLILLLLIPFIGISQITNRLIVTQNVPLDISANNYMFTVPPNDNRIYVAKMDSLKLHPYNIVGLETYLYLKGDSRYKSITYSPSFVDIVSGLGFNPYPASNPSGYISSYTESDPLVPVYAKLLTGFSIIKSDTDPLYVSLTGSYANPSFITSLPYSKITGAPAIPASQVNSDWNSVSGVSQILNKPSLSTVATTGNYSDLAGTPTIPTNTNQLTNGSGYITASSTNTLTNKSGNISQWTNDSGYLTGVTSAQINTALGYTPYNGTTNPNGFLTSVNSGQVTSALGFAPVTNARTITINGTTFDLSTNRTWTVGDVTTANLTAGLATKENTIIAGTTAQYWRGDKTWQTLDKTVVGLGNVDNTADVNKNVLSATKLTTSRNINGVAFDGTASITIVDATKEPTITAGTTAQYWRGDKSWQTLNTTVVPEGTNLYYTDTRARASISLTTTGSGAATYSGGVLNIPTPSIPNDYTNTVAVAGGAGGAVFYLTSDKTSTGSALYTNINFVSPLVNDSTQNYTYGWSYNSTTKALTVNTKVSTGINVALVGLTLLGLPSPVANGTIVNVLVKGN